MIIIETCPKCGRDLQDLVIATYPPIPKKECWNCGWSWVGEREKVARVPFGGNRLTFADTNLNATTTTEYLTYTNYGDAPLSSNTLLGQIIIN